MFIRGVVPECTRRIVDFQMLASSQCTCPGFRPIQGALGDASFAELDPEPEPEWPKLRIERLPEDG